MPLLQTIMELLLVTPYCVSINSEITRNFSHFYTLSRSRALLLLICCHCTCILFLTFFNIFFLLYSIAYNVSHFVHSLYVRLSCSYSYNPASKLSQWFNLSFISSIFVYLPIVISLVPSRVPFLVCLTSRPRLHNLILTDLALDSALL